jgi:hypothetical protein
MELGRAQHIPRPHPQTGEPVRVGECDGSTASSNSRSELPHIASPSSIFECAIFKLCLQAPSPSSTHVCHLLACPQAPPALSSAPERRPQATPHALAPSFAPKRRPQALPQRVTLEFSLEHHLRSNAGRSPELHPHGTARVAKTGWGRLLRPPV